MLRCAVATFILLASSTVAGAQRPDFSGTWLLDEPTASARPSVATVGDAAFRRGDMGSGWGSPLTITQSATRLGLAYPHFSAYDLQPPITLTYALDGSESRNAIMIGHAAAEQRSRTAWRDSSLVITTTHLMPAGSGDARTTETRHMLTLESPTTLVVETWRATGGRATPSTTKAVYRRG